MKHKFFSNDSWLVACLFSMAAAAMFFFTALEGSVAENLGLVPPVSDLQVSQTVSGVPSAFYFSALSGQDSNSCSSSAPCQTLDKARIIAESRRTASSDTTLFFAPGNYGQLQWSNFPGDFTNRITWTSIDQSNPARFTGVYIECDYCNANQTFSHLNLQPEAGNYSLQYVIQAQTANGIWVTDSEIHNEDLYGGSGLGLNGDRHLVRNNKIHDVVAGIRFKGQNMEFDSNELYRIPGSMISNTCGGANGIDGPQSAKYIKITNNILRDSVGDYPDEPRYENYDEPAELHASVFSIRGADMAIVGNRAWGIDGEKVWIQFYNGDCGVPNYDVKNITIAENIFYGNPGRTMLQTYVDVVTGPIKIFNNTAINFALFLRLEGEAYLGAGTEIYNNVVVGSSDSLKFAGAYNRTYEAYDEPTAQWVADHNVARKNGGFPSGGLDPSNIDLSKEIAAGRQPATLYDSGLFTKADYTANLNVECGPGSAVCDWTPRPDSILCTAGRNGSYVGAIPCSGQAQIDPGSQETEFQVITAEDDLPSTAPLAPPAPVSNWLSTFNAAQSVTVTANKLNIRDESLSGKPLGRQSYGSAGVITDLLPRESSGYIWVNVDFAEGADGWVADAFLE